MALFRLSGSMNQEPKGSDDAKMQHLQESKCVGPHKMMTDEILLQNTLCRPPAGEKVDYELCSRLQSVVDELREANTQLQSENDELLSGMHDLMTENEDLNATLTVSRSEAEGFIEERMNLLEERDWLMEQIEARPKSIVSSTEEMEEALEQLRLDVNQKLRVAKQERLSLEQELETSITKCDNKEILLEQVIREKDAKLQEVVGEREELRVKVNQSKLEKNALKKRLSESLAMLTDAQNYVRKLSIDKSEMEQGHCSSRRASAPLDAKGSEDNKDDMNAISKAAAAFEESDVHGTARTNPKLGRRMSEAMPSSLTNKVTECYPRSILLAGSSSPRRRHSFRGLPSQNSNGSFRGLPRQNGSGSFRGLPRQNSGGSFRSLQKQDSSDSFGSMGSVREEGGTGTKMTRRSSLQAHRVMTGGRTGMSRYDVSSGACNASRDVHQKRPSLSR